MSLLHVTFSPKKSDVTFERKTSELETVGTKLVNSCKTIASAISIGFGLVETQFGDMMFEGPHLLAPTGFSLWCVRNNLMRFS